MIASLQMATTFRRKLVWESRTRCPAAAESLLFASVFRRAGSPEKTNRGKTWRRVHTIDDVVVKLLGVQLSSRI